MNREPGNAQQVGVLCALNRCGQGTYHEIAAASDGIIPSTVWRRLSELVKAGYVDPVWDNGPVMRVGPSGRKCAVYKLIGAPSHVGPAIGQRPQPTYIAVLPCRVCGRLMTNPKSVSAGMGPKCACKTAPDTKTLDLFEEA